MRSLKPNRLNLALLMGHGPLTEDLNLADLVSKCGRSNSFTMTWSRAGYDGSYPRVATFARDWKANRMRERQMSGGGTFVPLAFDAGKTFPFDWSEDWAVLGGERTKLQVAHFKLAHSRAFFIRACLLQTHEMLCDAHLEAFRVLGGVPRRGIYDNMSPTVDKIGVGEAWQVNLRFQAIPPIIPQYRVDAGGYGWTAVACDTYNLPDFKGFFK